MSEVKPEIIIEEIEHFNSIYQWEGYRIKMSNETKNIVCKISNDKLCYEKFGIFCICKDNEGEKCSLEDFIGAKYISSEFKETNEDYLYNERQYGDNVGEAEAIATLTIKTDIGIIEIILYNQHNGYYPHDYYVQYGNIKKNGKL